MYIEYGSGWRWSLLLLISLSALFVGALLPVRGFAATPTLTPAATCNDTTGNPLPAGDQNTDLVVTGPCRVKAGTYTFHNVNIFMNSGALQGGSLTFDDAKIDLFAESILIENGGSMIAGSATAPIGTNGGVITIHLWGPANDPGITCKADTNNHCGVPIWGTNPAPSMIDPKIDPESCKLSKDPPAA